MRCDAQAVGFLLANLWFYGGVLFFGVIVYFIPEPSAADAAIKASEAPMPDKVTCTGHMLEMQFLLWLTSGFSTA